ncbi:MAG: MFS transporter [Variibacter sp.]
MLEARTDRVTVESGQSWAIACAVLAIMVVSYGSGLPTSVALTQIAASFEGQRSIPALANALVWLGSGVGGMLMGPLAARFGTRPVVIFGSAMIALGFVVSAHESGLALLVGHGLLIGILGTGAIHAPLYVYVSHWFDRRRGTALALVASGQYLGGTFWPALLLAATTRWGWERTMISYGVLALVTIVPIAAIFLKPVPKAPVATSAHAVSKPNAAPAAVFVLLCLASALCCIPMAMPTAHLPALCGDLGLGAGTGVAMLSLLLGLAFISRQFWGWLADRIGGLATIIAASACQAGAIVAFLLSHSEAGLYTASILFGLGFSGIIPAYVLAVRELFADAEASWRVPVLFCCSLVGMALGGWLAGAIYDHAQSYTPAFAVGLAGNVINLALLLWASALVTRGRLSSRPA